MNRMERERGRRHRCSGRGDRVASGTPEKPEALDVTRPTVLEAIRMYNPSHSLSPRGGRRGQRRSRSRIMSWERFPHLHPVVAVLTTPTLVHAHGAAQVSRATDKCVILPGKSPVFRSTRYPGRSPAGFGRV